MFHIVVKNLRVIHMDVCMVCSIYMYICMFICIYVCVYVYVDMWFIYVYIPYIYICIYLRVYIHIYVSDFALLDVLIILLSLLIYNFEVHSEL